MNRTEATATVTPDRMKVLLIGGGELFPHGTGAAARLRAYASGLRQNDVDVRVLLLLSLPPEEWPDTGADTRGTWRGVPFEYMSGVTCGQRGWLRRRVLDLRAIWRTLAAILRDRRESHRTAVVLIGTALRWILPIVTVCLVAGIPLIHDRTEQPFVYGPEAGALRALGRRWYTGNVFRMFDGVVVISTYLEEYVRSRVRRSAWIMRIPILVDADTFACEAASDPGLVGYAGSLSHPEELEQLIEAVSIVRRERPETRLRIVGGGSPSEIAFVRTQATRHGLADALELVGFARADQMPGLLCECSALALPRAAGVFSTAGMPTKLGEYLATGRPVVVTATGDIPLHLRDGVDAFVVAPDNVGAFAQALGHALYDASSQEIGRAGQQVARREFDPAMHVRRLLDAIERGRGGRLS
jgi:glycosyltransferase involved in cell wall biosynthesis